MSDRLEDLNVPPKLLQAIRNEVRSNTEQQLNDLWMVVHSLKDGVAKAGDSPSPQVVEEVKGLAETSKQQVEELRGQLDELGKDIQRKLVSLRKKLTEQSQEGPALPDDLVQLPTRLQSIQDKLDKVERESGQLGAAAALFENRLVDQESRLQRRLEESESRASRLAASAAGSGGSSPRSGGGGVDPLSDEGLLGLTGSVEFSLSDLAKVVIKYSASDLIVRPNSLPYTYLEGDLIPIGQKQLSPVDSYRVAMLALQPAERHRLVEQRSFSKLVHYHQARFLLNIYFERGELAIYARRLIQPGLSLESLDLPRALEVSLLEERGLLLLCGTSASQLKALAYALLTPINQQRRVRIFTLEDSIAYELPDELSLLSQLQRGTDISSPSSLLRLCPDVLYIQRLESAEDLQVALQLAGDQTLVIAGGTGNSVMSCLQNAVGCCPEEQRSALLSELGDTLRSVFCYRGAQGGEYLINSSKVRPWLDRGDFTALQTAVETTLAARPRPGGAVSAPTLPGRDKPLPPPSSESLSSRLAPPPPEPEPAAPTPVAVPAPEPPARPLEPPTGDDETLLGWL